MVIVGVLEMIDADDWIIVKGKTLDGTQTEWQVSDGEEGKRSQSYDFLSYKEAEEFCYKLNEEIK